MKEIISNDIRIESNIPTICVVGAGLSGLLTAIGIQEKGLPLSVVVLDKFHTETNTQISGMRIRAKRAGSKAFSSEERENEVVELLASQNNGQIVEPMREFAQLLTEELFKWNQRLSSKDPEFVHELSDWFGP